MAMRLHTRSTTIFVYCKRQRTRLTLQPPTALPLRVATEIPRLYVLLLSSSAKPAVELLLRGGAIDYVHPACCRTPCHDVALRISRVHSSTLFEAAVVAVTHSGGSVARRSVVLPGSNRAANRPQLPLCALLLRLHPRGRGNVRPGARYGARCLARDTM